jgi:hypothetical protein
MGAHLRPDLEIVVSMEYGRREKAPHVKGVLSV